jgi:hypothetical protein
LTDGVDELIREARRELARLSTECEQEIERAANRIREKYEREKAALSDSIALLEAAKANLSGHAPNHPTSFQKRVKQRGDARVRSESASGKFPVTEAVRKIVRGLKGQYSLEGVYTAFDKKHPEIRKGLNRTSIHRAVNLLVKWGEVEKVGLGKYKNRE